MAKAIICFQDTIKNSTFYNKLKMIPSRLIIYIIFIINLARVLLILKAIHPGANLTVILLFLLVISFIIYILFDETTTLKFAIIVLSIILLIHIGISLRAARLFVFEERSLSPSAQAKISEVFEALPRGIFAFYCPKEMTVGISEKCIARIANDRYLSNFREAVRKGINEDVEEIKLRYVSSIMNVKLTGRTFDIKPQEDGGNQIIIDGDFTSWQWDVTPQKSGMQKLKFLVSVILKVPDYRELIPKRYEENIVEVDVKVNPVFSTTNFITQHWKYLLLLLFFGLPVIVIIIFRKRYFVFGTSIAVGKIGSINANNNDGVINLLATSQDINTAVHQDKNGSASQSIKNAIANLPLSSPKQCKIRELLEKLRQLVEYNPGLNNDQKENALVQVKKLAEAAKEKAGIDLLYSATNTIVILKEIIYGASGQGAIFDVLAEIVLLLRLT